jgi:amino acid adenylation domain-containing protein
VTGLLGILKAGGAYVPLGPAYPKERLSYMLDEADIAVLVTQWTLVESITKGAATFLCLDAERDFIRKQSQSNVQSGLLGSNPAYVIYTSGSTGRPKGAMNSHEAICNRLMWMQDTYRLDETDRVLQKTPFSFDVSVWEFFWPLLTGACLVVAAAGGERDSAYLQKVISETRISTIHFVPSMLQVVLEQSGIESCGSLRRVICSGEALSLQLQERFFAGLSSELHNLYGPTEAAIDVTSRHCWPDGSQRTVPIGRPITNTQIYVLDKHMVPVTTSVPGELHIGGVGLARGYVNQPDLTSEKFIPNPFGNASGSRLYKTGDLARYLPDGEIDFLQRIDNQVKIRGFRIEPGEIETVLSQLAGVREAVVTVKQDETGEKRLVAYIVHDRKQARAIAQLRSALKQKLPYYMIPSEFIALDSIPLMSNGKMDRRALRDLETAGPASETDYAEPRSELERTIASVWRQALNRGEVGIHDNFFDLGGHSLLLIKIHNQLQGQLDRDVSVVQMFQYPTISSLADHLSRVSHDGIDEEPSFQQAHDRAEKLKQAINLQMQIHAKREVVQ